MKYQTYPAYKDSGVEMLGNLPNHWNEKQVRFLLRDGGEGIKIGPFGSALKLEDMVDSGVRVYGQENVIKKDFSLGKRIISNDKFEEMCVYQILPDDLLITMMGTSGKCELVPDNIETGIIDSHLLRLRVNKSEILPRFFRLLIDECYEIENQIKILGKGSIMHGLNSSIVKELRLPLPSLDEQKIILNFLDHETAKIDTLIEKQQRLIELLKEKRQAVISHAVTKGLNPNAPMKESGVAWLGDVPEGWRQIPLKLIVQTRKGAAFKADDFCDYGIRVVKASDIKQLSIRASEVFLPEKFIEIYPKAVLTTGDIILSTVGSNPDVVNSAVGQIGSVPNELANSLLNQNTVVYDPDEKKVVREYLFYVLQMRGYRDHLDLHAHGTANQSSLNISDMLDFVISLPPISEQIEIRDFLNLQENKLKLLEQKSIESGLLLQERRTALISAAVTGKIDVRHWGD
jgi:type I restriction enzyme S subunit